jgi:glycosyltransferase involved in cell wall biosynthesis
VITGSKNKSVLLIPNYNATDDLIKSIASIGSTEKIDVLVVDDGSKTPPVLSELKAAFNANGNVFLEVLSENKGITCALNVGVEWIKEKGYEYIARLDSGDLNKSNRFAKQEQFLEKNSNVGLVGSWVDFVDEQGALLFTLRHPTEDSEIKKAIYRFNPFVHPAVMFRASLIRLIGGYPDAYPALEDWACFMAMSEHTKMKNLPEVLLSYEVSSNSISSKKRFTQSKSKVKLLSNNYRLNINQSYGLLKSVLILFLPRKFLTNLKTMVNFK